ncbi:KAP family P-loop NTPase fold protein [Sulfurimonas sp.]
MAVLGLTDRPVAKLEEESLGVKDYMEALSEFVVTCETPMTISIQADWGAGKTSMMNLVKAKLEDENIETIWFNTWQFSQFNMGDDLPISLLGQFAKKFNAEDKSTISKSLNFLKKSARVATTTVADKVVSGAGGVVDALFDDTSKDSSEVIIELKNELNKAVAKKIEKSNSDRVVIFIDDLDRLVPEKAVELLETMKLFLDIHGCVFVLAIDYNVVVKGLEKKFGVSVDEAKGKSFFDKIIQLPFNLPVAQYDVSQYFKELLHGKFEYNENDIETFVKLANSSVGFNPRSMKRLFNSLQLLKMVAKSKQILDGDNIATAQEKQRILFAILCLQTAYESMYRFMLKHKSKINQDFFDTFYNLDKLKESEYYEEVKKELSIEDEDDDKVIRFIEFLNTFYDAIQLDSDSSEDSNENLSDKELENLIRFLSFSSITTSNTKGIDASSGTFQFKSTALPFMNDVLIPQYNDELSKINSTLKIFSNNNSGQIYFTFSQGSMNFDCIVWRNSKKITFALNHNSGTKKTVQKWCNKYLSQEYPNMLYNGRSKYGYLEFSSYTFSEAEMMQGEETKMEIYKNIALGGFGNIIPKLVEHYVETEPLVQNVKTFLHRLTVELKRHFTPEEGWIVNEGRFLNLDKHEPINIYHKDWGSNTFSISIEANKSLARELYFGIRREGKNIKFNSVQEKNILNLLKEKFSGGSATAWWVFYRDFEKYNSTILGDPYYEKTATYRYTSKEDENEALKYLLTQVVALKKYKEHLAALVSGEN